jgi:hypothetical protein
VAERIEKFTIDHLDDCAHLFMSAFNAEPWNDKYTLDTPKKQLAWHLKVPGCVGLVSVKEGMVVAFAIGYREPTDDGDVFHLNILCVRPGPREQEWVADCCGTSKSVCATPGSEPSTLAPAREHPPSISTRNTATRRVRKTSR